jgi:hypothetical protein
VRTRQRSRYDPFVDLSVRRGLIQELFFFFLSRNSSRYNVNGAADQQNVLLLYLYVVDTEIVIYHGLVQSPTPSPTAHQRKNFA